MSTFVLKIIACISMLIDHTTVYFVNPNKGFLFHLTLGSYEKDITFYVIGRTIGRIAFPIFAFLIVQGFLHTRNLKKYMLRLAVFAVISEIPFDFMCISEISHTLGIPYEISFRDFPLSRLCFNYQNIFFTLLIGLIAITLIDRSTALYQHNALLMNVQQILVILAAFVTLLWIKGDYSFNGYGILIIIGFYYGRRSKAATLLIFILLTGFLCADIQFMAILAAPLFYFYNGKKGLSCRYAFYAFYPVHLIILGLINLAVIR